MACFWNNRFALGVSTPFWNHKTEYLRTCNKKAHRISKNMSKKQLKMSSCLLSSKFSIEKNSDTKICKIGLSPPFSVLHAYIQYLILCHLERVLAVNVFSTNVKGVWLKLPPPPPTLPCVRKLKCKLLGQKLKVLFCKLFSQFF